MLDHALKYAQYAPVFPLIRQKKKPLFKGGHNFATQDKEIITQWWTNSPESNIGVNTAAAGIVVLDIDTADDHVKGQPPAGAHTLNNIGIWKRLIQTDGMQMYTTTSGGYHYWFKTDNELLLENRYVGNNELWEHVELLGGKGYTVVPPSTTPEGAYAGNNFDVTKIPALPDWLESMLVNRINDKSKAKTVTNYGNIDRGKTYTATLLERIVTGVDDGGRNVWLTSVTGSLLNTGMDTSKAFDLIQVINQEYVKPPLENKEVAGVFESILKREMGRY